MTVAFPPWFLIAVGLTAVLVPAVCWLIVWAYGKVCEWDKEPGDRLPLDDE